MRPMMASILSLRAAGGFPFGQAIGEVADQAIDIGLAREGRGFAHGDGAGAEAFEIEPEAFQLGRRFFEAGAILLGQFDDHRDQLGLAGDRAGGELGLEALIDQPLMGGVLVDQQQAIGVLGDDEIFEHLRPGGAEREFDELGAGLGDGFDAGAGFGEAGKTGLAGIGGRKWIGAAGAGDAIIAAGRGQELVQR